MNEQQVKENLLKIHTCNEDFSVVFNGKKSDIKYGVYYPDTKEIIIYNRNFEAGEAGDNRLFYTAIHELAHHIQYTEHKNEKGNKGHTKLFYSLLDTLTEEAEKLKLYRLTIDQETSALVDEAAEISMEIAALQRRLGDVLSKLHETCIKKGIRYEDVLKRQVKLSERTVKKIRKIAALNLPSDIGFEIQETIAGAKTGEQQEAMLKAAADGRSVAQVKQAGTARETEPDDETELLVKEKNRIEKAIKRLNVRLLDIVERIKENEKKEGG